MVRILDLDSMASNEVNDDNFIIVGNTPNLYGIKKIRFVDALQYFTSEEALTPSQALELISDAQISFTSNDVLTIGGDTSFTLNDSDPKTISISHNDGALSSGFTSRNTDEFIKRIELDQYGHIASVELESALTNFTINVGDNLTGGGSVTPGSNVVTINHEERDANVPSFVGQNDADVYVIKNLTFNNHGHPEDYELINLNERFLSTDSAYAELEIVAGNHLNGGGLIYLGTSVGNSVTIDHADKFPTLSNVTAQFGYVINSITFDAYGHPIQVGSYDYKTNVLDENYLTKDSANAEIEIVAGNHLNGGGTIYLPNNEANSVTINHANKSPTLSNVTAQFGYVINSITFDAYGHPIQVGSYDYKTNVLDTSYLASVSVLSGDGLDGGGSLTAGGSTELTISHGNTSNVDNVSNSRPSVIGLSRLNFDEFGHTQSWQLTDYSQSFLQKFFIKGDDAVRLYDSVGAFVGEGRNYTTTLVADSYGTSGFSFRHKVKNGSLDNQGYSPSDPDVIAGISFDSFGHVTSVNTFNLYDNLLQQATITAGDNLTGGGTITPSSTSVTINHEALPSPLTNFVADGISYVSSLTFDVNGHVTAYDTEVLSAYIDSEYVANIISTSTDVENAVSSVIENSTTVKNSLSTIIQNEPDIINSVQGAVDSAYIATVITSDYINDRVDIPVDSGAVTSIINSVVDSAYINNLVDVGIDSQAILELIDSAYVKSFVDSDVVQSKLNLVTTKVTIKSGESDGLVIDSGNIFVNGDITATGNVTAYYSMSDVNLKENLEKIDNSLSKVEQLTGYTFNYIGGEERHTGLIAQDVEDVLPEVVYNINSKGHKAIRYGNMLGLIVEAIKELKQEIDDIKGKIE